MPVYILLIAKNWLKLNLYKIAELRASAKKITDLIDSVEQDNSKKITEHVQELSEQRECLNEHWMKTNGHVIRDHTIQPFGSSRAFARQVRNYRIMLHFDKRFFTGGKSVK